MFMAQSVGLDARSTVVALALELACTVHSVCATVRRNSGAGQSGYSPSVSGNVLKGAHIYALTL